ncbi:GT2 family glycosyltransferase [Knoellia remsis]|uniref:GT2 family glycosyltransferase n=1 Tax=Knoellia remsis TaxID=407159 RepID=A0A2T0UD38_9MICO|nr:glycosyltransferase family 2 protein [Knoellia remsis]PRY55843.1 GT2 family glycosyltransferase [Knoellia remsis]
MTLTPAAVLPPASAPATGPTVRAVIVTTGSDTGLRALLDALAASSTAPDEVTVLDTTSGDDVPAVVAAASSGTFPVERVRLDAGMPARAALQAWLASGEVSDEDLVWVLPTGSVPEPEALTRLVAAHRRSPSVGIVGPKHVVATSPGQLRSVGIRTTRSGRVIEDPAPGTHDQGQHDARRDVIAVPFAGLLGTAGVLRELGWENGFGDLGADLDLGWRAQRRGHRVVVVPEARMRSTGAAGLATATTGPRRRAARRVALARASWWAVPFLALWVALSAIASGIALLLLKRPRAAAVAFADLGALDPVRALRSKWRTRGPAAVRHRDIATVFVPASTVVRRGLDRAHESLVAPSALPDEGGTEAAERRSLVAQVALHPAVLATVAALAVVVAAGREIGGGLVSRLGSGVTGGELVTTRATASSLWHAAFDGWSGSGLGSSAIGSPSLALLAIPTWFVEQLPGGADLTSPSGAVVGALLVLALPAATVTAYLSAGVLTGRRLVRGIAALAWVSTGAAGAAVAQGRLGAVAALVLLPVVLAGLVMLARPTGTATVAFATALAAAVLGAFAPPLLVLVVLACLAVALCGMPGARGRALVPAVVAPLLLGPWIVDAVQDWPVLATGPGLTQWGTTVPEPAALALLHPGGDGSTPWWVGGLVVAAGLLGLLAPGRVRSVTTGAALLGLASLAAVLASPRVSLSDDGLTPWVGTFMLPLTLALLASAVIGVEALRGRARAMSLTGLVAVALVGAVALAWFGFGSTLGTWTDPRPAVAVDQASGDLANRTVLVTPEAGGAAYRIVGRETGALARTLPRDAAADARIAPDVSGLLDGSREDAGERLAEQAIGFLGVAQSAGDEVTRRLDSSDKLSRLASRDGYDFWRVSSAGEGATVPVAPTRLTLVRGAERVLVPTTGEHAATETTITARAGDVLTVAEPPQWARHAEVRVDGRELNAADDAAVPTYALPAGEHRLSIDVRTDHPWWRLLQGLALFAVAFLAIPFGTRASRSRR